jgi:antitoxin VapB
MPRAKVFKSGNSQAVRIPKELRFPAGVREVVIRREGDRIVLEPVEPTQWPEEFWDAFGEMPEGFERPRQSGRSREPLDL